MLGMLHLFSKFCCLGTASVGERGVWVMYGDVLFVSFGSGFRPSLEKLTEKFLYKIHRVGIDMCLTVYLNMLCALYYLTAESW